MTKFFMLLFLPFAFVGCATISKEDCDSGKWHDIGKRDGAEGNIKDFFKLYQKSCESAKNATAEELYFKGWNEGHIVYCTDANGYSAGLNGIHSATYCDPTKFPEYGENYKLGYKVASLQDEKNDINREIKSRNEDRSVVSDISRALAILTGTNPNEKLTQRKSELNEKIRTIDSNAPGGPQIRYGDSNSAAIEAIRTKLMATDPESFENKTGATIGTVIGFGLGHAIQGRYMDSGWKWTLGEIGTTVLASSTSSSDCSDGLPDPVSGTIKKICVPNGKDPNIALGTILFWLGVRVWQSYDLWSYPPRNSSTANSIVPTPTGIAWAF